MEEEVKLKQKITLKKKGDVVEVATFGRMVITLNWTLQDIGGGDLGPDFDLMAYYKCKDGREGGVCSSAYNQNVSDMGSVNNFPWMELDKDDKADDGAQIGDPAGEEMKISRLEDFDAVYICVINYDDALEGKKVSFGNYKGFVSIKTDSESGDNNFEVPLDSQEEGHVVVVCKIDNSTGRPRLFNENQVLSLSQFSKTIPGAKLILE